MAGNARLPMVGFGTYLIKEEEVSPLVFEAIRSGYRHVDTAEGYRNERGVGRGLIRAMNELGLSRDELFVTTKLWPGNAEWKQTPKTYQTTMESFNASLDRLQLDYVDLYLIHAPFPREQRLEQWSALIELQQQGKAKAIGVSNYGESHIREIESAGLRMPDANQIELHPWTQKPELVTYLSRNDIAIIAYSSLVPLANWRSDGKAKNTKDSPFGEMADRYGVSEAQFLLRWGLQKGYAVLPKSVHVDRIRQNIDVFEFEIAEADMAVIDTMDRGDGIAWQSGDPVNAP